MNTNQLSQKSPELVAALCHELVPPTTAVRRLYVDCLAHDPAVVDLATSTFGSDRVLLGSDWPFPMGTDDPVALVEHRGHEFVRRVAVNNPAELFRHGPA